MELLNELKSALSIGVDPIDIVAQYAFEMRDLAAAHLVLGFSQPGAVLSGEK